MIRPLILSGLLAGAAPSAAAAKLDHLDTKLNLEEKNLDELMERIDRRVERLDGLNKEIHKLRNSYMTKGLSRAFEKRREELYEEITAQRNGLTRLMDVFKRKRDAFQIRSTQLTVAHMRRQELPENSIDVVFRIMKLQAYNSEIRHFRLDQAKLLQAESFEYAAAKKRRRRALLAAGAAGGGVLLMGAAALWWRRRRSLNP